MSEARKKLGIPDLGEPKRRGERVVLASVTDYLMAQWAKRGGTFPDTEHTCAMPAKETQKLAATLETVEGGGQ